MERVRAGALDRQITIEAPTSVDGEYGPQPGPWVPLIPIGSPAVGGRLWANVQDVLPSHSEAVRQGLEIAKNLTRIRIRYRSDVTSAMRITLHGETDVVYQIVAGPAEIGRKQWTEFMVEKYSS